MQDCVRNNLSTDKLNSRLKHKILLLVSHMHLVSYTLCLYFISPTSCFSLFFHTHYHSLYIFSSCFILYSFAFVCILLLSLLFIYIGSLFDSLALSYSLFLSQSLPFLIHLIINFPLPSSLQHILPPCSLLQGESKK